MPKISVLSDANLIPYMLYLTPSRLRITVSTFPSREKEDFGSFVLVHILLGVYCPLTMLHLFETVIYTWNFNSLCGLYYQVVTHLESFVSFCFSFLAILNIPKKKKKKVYSNRSCFYPVFSTLFPLFTYIGNHEHF